MTPLEFIRSMKAVNETAALAILSEYDFDFTKAQTPSGKLSGGERSRLQILGLILAGANFLLLDEPTNNFDIASTEALEDALLDQAGTILAISHDRYFLDRICTRIIEVGDGLVRDYPGGYAVYRDMPDVGTWATRDWPPRADELTGKRGRKGAVA
jgi:ATP-binding cassette subfamily F protein 3